MKSGVFTWACWRWRTPVWSVKWRSKQWLTRGPVLTHASLIEHNVWTASRCSTSGAYGALKARFASRSNKIVENADRHHCWRESPITQVNGMKGEEPERLTDNAQQRGFNHTPQGREDTRSSEHSQIPAWDHGPQWRIKAVWNDNKGWKSSIVLIYDKLIVGIKCGSALVVSRDTYQNSLFDWWWPRLAVG